MTPVPVPPVKDIAKDVIIAILGSSVGLAGLLLVFVGFVYSKAGSFQTRRGDFYKNVAKAGVAPFSAAIIAAWFCLLWLAGHPWAYGWAFFCFAVSTILTGVYGVVALLFYL